MTAADDTARAEEFEQRLKAAAEGKATLTSEEQEALAEAIRQQVSTGEGQFTAEQLRAIEADVRAKMAADRERTRPRVDPTTQRNYRVGQTMRRWYDVVSLPFAIAFLMSSHRFRPEYGLTWRRRVELGLKMFRNTRKITTGTSYKAHLAMAAKLFEMSPKVKGAVVECGCWKGGSTANLSLICDIVGRDLIVYDSFEGLPTAPANDKYAWKEAEGYFRGDLQIVQDHVRQYGVIDRCTFRKGWFSNTLPHHTEPIVFAFLDVDYASSLHDCVLLLWPHLADEGYIFIDEYTRLDYCALFYSEKWWDRYFDRPPPGMMGVGTGVGVGQFYLGPMKGRPWSHAPTSVAYTRKDFYGMWDYDPDNPDEVEKARGQ